MSTMRKIDYEVILKKVNWMIQSKPQSTSEKEFITQFSGVLSIREAKRFWERLLSFGNLFLEAIDTKRYRWNINTSYFTRDSLEKHFRQGDILSSRGRIPGKKYPKVTRKQPVVRQDPVIYPGWISTITL